MCQYLNKKNNLIYQPYSTQQASDHNFLPCLFKVWKDNHQLTIQHFNFYQSSPITSNKIWKSTQQLTDSHFATQNQAHNFTVILLTYQVQAVKFFIFLLTDDSTITQYLKPTSQFSSKFSLSLYETWDHKNRSYINKSSINYVKPHFHSNYEGKSKNLTD